MPSHIFSVTYALEEQLSPISAPIARTFSLSHLPKHFPLLLLSFVFFQLLQWISPSYLFRLSPTFFGKATKRLKHDWVAHAVSTVHALVIVPLAFSCLHLPDLSLDKAFGFNERVGDLFAITCGYFLWDTLDSIFHFADIGFVIHGFSCLTVYLFGFRPFLGYYGARFLLWELSTPFLNIHWFLDKTNRTGGYLQIANGVILLITFFLARICYGGMMSLQFFSTLQEVQSEIPVMIVAAYAMGNIALQALNWFWFYKMLRNLRSRLNAKPRPGHLHKNGDAVTTNGVNGKVKLG